MADSVSFSMLISRGRNEICLPFRGYTVGVLNPMPVG